MANIRWDKRISCPILDHATPNIRHDVRNEFALRVSTALVTEVGISLFPRSLTMQRHRPQESNYLVLEGAFICLVTPAI